MNPLFVAVLLIGLYMACYEVLGRPLLVAIFEEMKKRRRTYRRNSQENTWPAEARMEISQLLRLLTDKEDEKKKLLHQLTALREEMEQRIEVREQEKRDLNELKQLIEQIQNELEDSRKSNSELRKRLRESEHEKMEDQVTIRKLREDIEQIQNELEEAHGLPCYKMDRHPRGLCVIINIENFNNKENNREGSQVDELKLKNLFETLCFTVCVLKDLPRNKLQEAAADFASKDHSQFDAFVFVVMSHGGERDVILCADERTVSVEDLMSEFKWSKCPTLKDKPKLFFIQACRGTTETETFLCTTTDPCVDRFSPDSKLPRSVCPEEADFLLAFSTVPGYVSFRDKENGTLFVQTLVEVIRNRHRQDHLLDMLTEVNRLVAERGQAVQVPAPVHTLRRKLYL